MRGFYARRRCRGVQLRYQCAGILRCSTPLPRESRPHDPSRNDHWTWSNAHVPVCRCRIPQFIKNKFVYAVSWRTRWSHFSMTRLMKKSRGTGRWPHCDAETKKYALHQQHEVHRPVWQDAPLAKGFVSPLGVLFEGTSSAEVLERNTRKTASLEEATLFQTPFLVGRDFFPHFRLLARKPLCPVPTSQVCEARRFVNTSTPGGFLPGKEGTLVFGWVALFLVVGFTENHPHKKKGKEGTRGSLGIPDLSRRSRNQVRFPPEARQLATSCAVPKQESETAQPAS